ncbi:MAG: hypothetical protein V4726_11130 [Verrucomicrobiota bacterium]
MSALLHPTPGSVLNQFTTRQSDIYPHLAFPFYHQLGTKTGTFVSDGGTIMLWTARRLPGYRDWVRHTGPLGFEVDAWLKFHQGGASFPLPPLPPHRTKPVRMVIAGNIAYLPRRLVAALAAMDTCWLGLSRIRPERNGLPLPFVSLHWSLGGMAGEGVINCEDAPPPAAKTKAVKPS